MQIRKLTYPLLESENRELATNTFDVTETLSWPTEDSTERVFFTIGLSLDEYIQLASCVDVGRDIAYPDESFYTWYLWTRITLMSICDQVADCIETSEVTQQAIAQAISDSSIIQQAIADYVRESGLNSPTGQISPDDTINGVGATNQDDRIGTIEDCDNDKLWGALRYGVVAYLADNALNFLEDLNTIADKGQRASRLVEGIPIVGNVLSATIAEFSEVIPDLLNLFNAHDSETVRDEIACELFALGCEDCLLPTYGELIGYYSALGVTGYDDLDNVAFQLATDLLIGTSTLTASIVYHTIIAYELAVLYFGAKFNQALGANIVKVWALIGEDFANDNWMLLCDPCGDGWCYDFDWLTSQDGFIDCDVNGALTQYSVGVGFYGSGTNEDRVAAYISDSFTFNYATLTFTRSAAIAPSVTRLYVNTGGCSLSGTFYGANTTVNNGDGTFTARWELLPSIDITSGLMVYMEAGGTTPVYEFQKLRLSNPTGINPFGTDNCI